MPRTKGSKNRPKTNNDYASQIAEKQESITFLNPGCIRCQTVRPAKGVQSDRWKSCQISC